MSDKRQQAEHILKTHAEQLECPRVSKMLGTYTDLEIDELMRQCGFRWNKLAGYWMLQEPLPGFGLRN